MDVTKVEYEDCAASGVPKTLARSWYRGVIIKNMNTCKYININENIYETLVILQ